MHRYWLEAEESSHKVGGEQKESAEERADALMRGKATSSVIGTRAMGQRFNVLMTIQVPLEQQQRPQMAALWGMSAPVCASMSMPASCAAPRYRCGKGGGGSRCEQTAVVGHSSGARVSRGSEYDAWPGLSVKTPKRNLWSPQQRRCPCSHR